MNYRTIIIIGAGRSGTNMLRNALTDLPGLGTWPCDEINYIWRHGNAGYPSDAFQPEMARPSVARYIRGKFDAIARRYNVETVVEKTCANSLRVEFVDRILPKTDYIFIRRNGIDVVCSAAKRWTAALDVPYILRKARFVPAMDMPYYGSRYLLNCIHRIFSRQKRLSSWGPRLENMPRLLEETTLEEVCALQWKHCLDSAARAFKRIAPHRYVSISYEEFVADPVRGLNNIVQQLDLQAEKPDIERAVMNINARSVGRGHIELAPAIISRLRPLIEDTMGKWGYA